MHEPLSGAPPRIVGLVRGKPFDRETWSGGSYNLFSALARRQALEAAIDVSPPPLLDGITKAVRFSRNREVWRQRYLLSAAVRREMGRYGGRRAQSWNARPEVLLQIGAWFDLSGSTGLTPRLRCSYHDSTLALYLRRPDLRLPRSGRLVRRALEAERRTYDSMDVIFVMSSWLGRSFVEDFDQPPEKIVVARAGAGLDGVPPAPERDPAAAPRFLWVGKDWSRKGGPVLVEAFRRVRARRPDAELWIVGQDDLGDLGAGITVHGRIARSQPGGDARIAALYSGASVFVMPSLYEPFGYAFTEAMAFRLPCIGTTLCAMPEIIDDGVTGYLVPPSDVGVLAERMLALCDPDCARTMGEAAFERFRGRYTWDVVAGRMLDEIRRRLAASSEGRTGDE